MTHALVHAPDQHHDRRPRGQRQIPEDREAKAERNGNAGEDAEAGDADEEDDEIEIAERPQIRLRQPEQADDDGHREHGRQHQADIAGAQ